MVLLEWSDRLDVKVEAMNREHKQLLVLMNKLYDRDAAKADRAELKGILKELAEYTVKHFADEEAYLVSIKYPEFDKHKLIHQDLLEKFKGHVAAFDAKGSFDPAFFTFLKMWLSAHIQGIDMKYGEYSKTQR